MQWILGLITNFHHVEMDSDFMEVSRITQFWGLDLASISVEMQGFQDLVLKLIKDQNQDCM